MDPQTELTEQRSIGNYVNILHRCEARVPSKARQLELQPTRLELEDHF
jgi:hypothetical protein